MRAAVPVEKKKVLLIDDHPALAFSIKTLVNMSSFAEVVGSAIDGATGLLQVEEHNPDIVVLDLILPDMHGFEVARRIRDVNEDICIIIYTGEENYEEHFDILLDIGVSAIWHKTASLDAFMRLIENVADGYTMLPIPLFQSMRRNTQVDIVNFGLNETELAVIRLLMKNPTMSNSEIAEELQVVIKTVESKLTRIYKKLGTSTRHETIQKCLNLKFV